MAKEDTANLILQDLPVPVDNSTPLNPSATATPPATPSPTSSQQNVRTPPVRPFLDFNKTPDYNSFSNNKNFSVRPNNRFLLVTRIGKSAPFSALFTNTSIAMTAALGASTATIICVSCVFGI